MSFPSLITTIKDTPYVNSPQNFCPFRSPEPLIYTSRYLTSLFFIKTVTYIHFLHFVGTITGKRLKKPVT